MTGVLDSLQVRLLDAAEAQAIDVRGGTRAAVLVPIHVKADGSLSIVFTRRHNDLRRHAGEISFPGGRSDPADPDLIATAVREAHEEIGLPSDGVQLLGALQPTPTLVTGYAVYPFVAEVTPPARWTPNAAEVAEVLEFSVQELSDGYGRRRARRTIPMRTDTYLVDGHLIWGATARILADLLDRLGRIS